MPDVIIAGAGVRERERSCGKTGNRSEDGGHLAFLFETEFLSVALVVLELTL